MSIQENPIRGPDTIKHSIDFNSDNLNERQYFTCLKRKWIDKIKCYKYNSNGAAHPPCKRKGDLLYEVKMRNINVEEMYIAFPVTESVQITAKHPIFIGGTCQSCANNVDLTYTMTRMIAKQVVITDIDKGNI